MPLYLLHAGAKALYGVSDGESVTFRCDCNVYPEALIELRVTRAQAEELVQRDRRSIQDIVPEMDRRLREIFVTGITPAEFDTMFSADGALPLEDYPGYTPDPEMVGVSVSSH